MDPILVCESVQARSLAELVRARDAAQGADLVELRLDGLPDPNPGAALQGRTRPVVVTCRPRWEGGAFDGDEATRRRILEDALGAGADFVDVEWQATWSRELVSRWPDRVVLSWHDFDGTPLDVAERAHAMAAAGPAVVKVAVTATRLRDLQPLLALGARLPRGTRLVAIAMGSAGVATRALPQRFGSCWTYAGRGVAPGQMATSRLVEEFRVRRTSSRTTVLAVVGRPIGHSLSPVMHNAALAALGIDAVYLPLEASDFDDFLWAADALDVAGASVTAPFKEAAARRAGRLEPGLEEVGAANTLRREGDGTWAARNTDGEGFLFPLRDVSLGGLRAAVLGSGGAARAVVAALKGQGARVSVHARRTEAAEALSHRLGVAWGHWPPRPGDWDLLVNTTPVGTWPDVSALPIEAPFVHGPLVYDLVYNPARTALLRTAAAHGCRTIGGLEMLVAQAGRQFEWWTSRQAPLEVMREAATRRLAQFQEDTPLAANER